MTLWAVRLADGKFWHKASQEAGRGSGFAVNALNGGCLYSTEKGAVKAAEKCEGRVTSYELVEKVA